MNPDVNPAEAVIPKKESETPQGTERIQSRKVFVPHVDIVETDEALVLVADMPGVDEQGVDVMVEKNVLTLKGLIAGGVPAGYKLSYEEYGVGDFERSFTIPNEIDREAIHARIKDGVLTLTLPKAPQIVAKKVPVVAG